MKKTILLFTILASAFAQTPAERAAQARVEVEARARELERVVTQARGGVYQLNVARVGIVDPIQGRPFSATEVNRSTQVLAGGARIENKTESKLYRDVDGRTRIDAAGGSTTIVDPVAGFRATLNSRSKTATKALQAPGARPVAVATYRGDSLSPAGIGNEEKQSLGSQIVNGVTAVGERVTITIPRGQIGNDRDLKVATERWYSNDLQMLVKSVNDDPRFGETVYELTNVLLASPDPSLFQIPADYSISEGGRGRGGAPTPAPGSTGGRGGARGK